MWNPHYCNCFKHLILKHRFNKCSTFCPCSATQLSTAVNAPFVIPKLILFQLAGKFWLATSFIVRGHIWGIKYFVVIKFFKMFKEIWDSNKHRESPQWKNACEWITPDSSTLINLFHDDHINFISYCLMLRMSTYDMQMFMVDIQEVQR